MGQAAHRGPRHFTMSDVEGDDAPMPAAAAAAAAAPMDIQKAIQEVLKEALIHDGLARGLRETTKALDKRQAIACILAENCDEENYKKPIKALCMEHEIPLITVDDGQKLGEWAGLCKIDKEGEARKIVRCSCVVIKDWGKPSQAQEYLEDHIKKQKDRQVLLRCHQGLGQAQPGTRVPRGPHQETE